MIKNRTALGALITAATVLVLASPALARVQLTQNAADAANAREVAIYVDVFDSSYDPSQPIGWVGGYGDDSGAMATINAPVDSVESDPCELTSRYRAECESTIWLKGGLGCDVSVQVRTTRRGRVVRDSDVVCDGDDED